MTAARRPEVVAVSSFDMPQWCRGGPPRCGVLVEASLLSWRASSERRSLTVEVLRVGAEPREGLRRDVQSVFGQGPVVRRRAELECTKREYLVATQARAMAPSPGVFKLPFSSAVKAIIARPSATARSLRIADRSAAS